MFLSHLNNYRKTILHLLLPFFILAGFNFGSWNHNTPDFNQTPKEAIILDLVSFSTYTGTFHQNETKPGSQTKIILTLDLLKNSTALYCPDFFNGAIRIESIKNFRLRSFITSHFSTST